MRGFPIILLVLLSTIGISAAQNAASPRLDSEGNQMDATPPQTPQPHHPADALAPNTPKSPNAGSTTGQAPRDERFPADRGETRPVPSAPK
jgi:hypothetical protein